MQVTEYEGGLIVGGGASAEFELLADQEDAFFVSCDKVSVFGREMGTGLKNSGASNRRGPSSAETGGEGDKVMITARVGIV